MRKRHKTKKDLKRSGIFINCIFIGASLILSSCVNTDNTTNSSESLNRENLWHIQLQDAEYDNLKNANIGTLVIDQYEEMLSRDEINALSENRMLLSYLSIGAAEDYRDYWQPEWKIGNPDFIEEELRNWKGNYYVRYWDPNWQEIIFIRIQEIAEHGYDGAYLDMVDSYYYFESNGRESAGKEMIDFIRSIRIEAKDINPEFLIVPQNAPELYEYNEFREIIDGLGKEDTWYYGNTRRPQIETDYELKYLDQIIEDGKFVLAIDYVTSERNIEKFYESCIEHGFYPTVSSRELDKDFQPSPKISP
ncbi:MAG: MJ1477/TM1410 family putative glycoside hydrolase [Candidatus Woesearchaeota archaeon]